MNAYLHPRTWSIPVRIFAVCMLVSFGILCIGRNADADLMSGLRSCAKDTTGSSELIVCTHEVVRSLLEKRSPSELLNEVGASQVPKPYGDCHSVAHVIGQETYRRSGNLEAALSQCNNRCFGGCLHGALGEVIVETLGIQNEELDIAHMDAKQIEDIGATFCRDTANEELCHGIGHILYSLTENFKAATQECSAIATGLLLDQCLTGVYMQGIGGVRNSLVLGSTVPSFAEVPEEDYRYPCNTIPGDQKQHLHSCFKYLPPYQEVLFARNNISDPAEKLNTAVRECETLGVPERTYCFEGIGRYTPFYVAATGTTTPGIIGICADLPNDSDRKSCVHGHVRILRSYGRSSTALEYCTAVRSAELQDSCFFSFFSYNGLESAPSEESVCAGATSKELCTSELRAYTKELDALRSNSIYSY